MIAIKQLLLNQVFISSIVGWAVAQILKTLIDFWSSRSLSLERLYGSGGMPSSHSSTVCALTVASACKYGLGSFEFAVSFVLSTIVMHDAMGVRRETGKQAELLNMIMAQDFWQFDNPEKFQQNLKVLVGHTPLQVFMGAVLGIIIAFLLDIFIYSF